MVGISKTAAEIAGYVAAQENKRPVKQIILHHTAGPSIAGYKGLATVKEFHRQHTQVRGWSDIGYHYLIGPDGLIWIGRPLSRDGAHVATANTNTVGVSLIINAENEPPTAAQAAACGAVLRALLQRFSLDPVAQFSAGRGFHKDYNPTACPGRHVTKAKVLGWIKGAQVPEFDAADDGPDVSPWAQADVDYCVAHGIMAGRASGQFDGLEAVTRQELAVVAARLHRGLVK